MVGKRLTPIARRLRAHGTDAERLLWGRLRGSQLDNFKFVRQFPIGNAVTDFACRSARVAIELDGGQHADSRADADRTRSIEAFGYIVIRFWNNEVIENLDGVLQTILAELDLATSR
jgi:very-short-patch-repair endonuclease